MPRATSLAVVRLQKLSESNFSSCLCFVTESFLPQEYPRSPLPSDGFCHQGSSSARCLHLCCQTRESWCLSPVGIRFLLLFFFFLGEPCKELHLLLYFCMLPPPPPVLYILVLVKWCHTLFS